MPPLLGKRVEDNMGLNGKTSNSAHNTQPPPYYLLPITCPLCDAMASQLMLRPRRIRRAYLAGNLFTWLPIWTGTAGPDTLPGVRPMDVGMLHCGACGFTESQQNFRGFDRVRYPNIRQLKNLLLEKRVIRRGPYPRLVQGISTEKPTDSSVLRVHLAALILQLLPHPESRDFVRIAHCALRLARLFLDRLHYGGPSWDVADTVSLPTHSPIADRLRPTLEELKSVKEVWSVIPLGYTEALELALNAYGLALERGFPGQNPLRRLEVRYSRIQIIGELGDLQKTSGLLEDLSRRAEELIANWGDLSATGPHSEDDRDGAGSSEEQLIRLHHFSRTVGDLHRAVRKQLAAAA
ncbi:MAG: hypothetical protein GF355_13960 [Candidatus Eisenbacteria bacterium]|nr:hypothetical protein [Candidatus Eisenbacteria bacterium]